ncbi:hypothetical protein K456DRAFT_42762 [Colletotrichum gloeosporioides 23]|nr:hypothetical protein K456DRAFT_42762 [Colletotrichum gloeosporioides 23]
MGRTCLRFSSPSCNYHTTAATATSCPVPVCTCCLPYLTYRAGRQLSGPAVGPGVAAAASASTSQERVNGHRIASPVCHPSACEGANQLEPASFGQKRRPTNYLPPGTTETPRMGRTLYSSSLGTLEPPSLLRRWECEEGLLPHGNWER